MVFCLSECNKLGSDQLNSDQYDRNSRGKVSVHSHRGRLKKTNLSLNRNYNRNYLTKEIKIITCHLHSSLWHIHCEGTLGVFSVSQIPEDSHKEVK